MKPFNPEAFSTPTRSVYEALHTEAKFNIDSSRIDVFGFLNPKVKKWPGSAGRIVGIQSQHGSIVISESHERDEIAFAIFPNMDLKGVAPLIRGGEWIEHIHSTVPYKGTSPETWSYICHEMADSLKEEED